MQRAPIECFDLHPLVQDIPILPENSEDYQRLVESIKREGVFEPLKCVEATGGKLLVVDGLHRLTIARLHGTKELPYRTVAESQLIEAVCHSAVRAEWSKSALAYRLWPMFAARAHKRGGDRRSKGTEFPLITSAEIAEKLQVSEKLVDQAKKIHALFDGKPKRREELEHKILAGKISLKQALDKIGNGHTKLEIPKSPSFHFAAHLRSLENDFENWQTMNHSDQENATSLFSKMIRRLPEAMQVAVLETLEVAFR